LDLFQAPFSARQRGAEKQNELPVCTGNEEQASVANYNWLQPVNTSSEVTLPEVTSPKKKAAPGDWKTLFS